MPAPHRRKLSLVPIITSIAVLAMLTALGVRIYRHPRETLIETIRAAMLLVGIREGTCNLGGVSMHFYCAGRRGTPIVLIHGPGNSAEVWAALIPLLGKEYLVYAPDMPGSGKTPLAPEGTSIATHVFYLERFLDALGYPRVKLIGNSMGGWIATYFAVAHPERVECLYLLNSAGIRHKNARGPGGYAGREELDSVLSQVHVPTTIIWGERDTLLSRADAHDLRRGIRGAQLIFLPDVGHMPQVQAPFQVARLILEPVMSHQ
ncbi:MAG TPA: alpha/beta fold hydrolase [Ktedonobacteraceae bacterium]|nr:alpha/beta fold hydrolase [Ktedonobacteraceae bacterium]